MPVCGATESSPSSPSQQRGGEHLEVDGDTPYAGGQVEVEERLGQVHTGHLDPGFADGGLRFLRMTAWGLPLASSATSQSQPVTEGA